MFALGRMTPLQAVSSFERHIQVETKIGLTTLVAAREKALQPVLARLRQLQPTIDEVTELLVHLGRDDCIWAAEERKSIGDVCNSTMVDEATRYQKATVRTQKHMFLHKYLPLRLWAFLESEDTETTTGNSSDEQFMPPAMGTF